jgi:proteic killer suppression protein
LQILLTQTEAGLTPRLALCWRNAATRKVWEGERPNQFCGLDCEAAIDLLLALNVAGMLQDLSPLRSVGLHKLKGERNNQWAMHVNAGWRI